MYTVWRRNDGYVNASKSRVGLEPKDLNFTRGNGSKVTFEVLLHTEDWDVARALIVSERSKNVL